MVSVEVNTSILFIIMIYLYLDNELDRKINVTAMQILLVQNRQQTHGWTLIVSGTNGLFILKWSKGYGKD